MKQDLNSLIEILDAHADLISHLGLFKRYFEEWYNRLCQRPTSAWTFANVVSYADKNPEWVHLTSKDVQLAEKLLDTIAPDRPSKPQTLQQAY